MIKSYHPIPSTSLIQPSNYYVGLDLEFFEPKISDDPFKLAREKCEEELVEAVSDELESYFGNMVL